MSLLLSSCDPLKRGSKECQTGSTSNYHFNLPVYYTPHTDTIQLGDTLWMESSFSNQLRNEDDNKTYTLNDFKFGMVGVMNDLSTNPTVPYTGFILVDSTGNVDNASRNGMYFNVDFRYENNTYYWKRGIVLNKPGAFYIDVFSFMYLESLSHTGQHITKCPNEYVNPLGKPMNVENNYYLLATSPDPYIKQGEEAFKNSFAFYVKE